MRAEISFMDITEALPADMLIAAMGGIGHVQIRLGSFSRLSILVVNITAVGTGSLMCAVT